MEQPEQAGSAQTPPDLVVKFQPIVIVGFILCWSCSHASCINGKSRAELPSTSEDSCPPLNPMECANSLAGLAFARGLAVVEDVGWRVW